MISRKLPPVVELNVPRSIASATPARPQSRPEASQAKLTTRVRRDPAGARQRGIVGGGAHRLADARVLEQHVHARPCSAPRRAMMISSRGVKIIPRMWIELLRLQRIAVEARAGEDLKNVVENDPDRDGDHHHRELTRPRCMNGR